MKCRSPRAPRLADDRRGSSPGYYRSRSVCRASLPRNTHVSWKTPGRLCRPTKKPIWLLRRSCNQPRRAAIGNRQTRRNRARDPIVRSPTGKQRGLRQRAALLGPTKFLLAARGRHIRTRVAFDCSISGYDRTGEVMNHRPQSTHANKPRPDESRLGRDVFLPIQSITTVSEPMSGSVAGPADGGHGS